MRARTLLQRAPGPVWIVATIAGVAAAAWPLLFVVAPNADDGLVGANGMLLAEGLVPHRDYFSPIWAGADLLYGAWFALLGASYVTLRLLTLLGLVGGAAALFAVGRRLVPDRWAFGVALLWGGWAALFLDRGPYHLLSPAALVAMTWAILRGSRSSRAWAWYVLAGGLGGVATLLLQTRGVVALAGVGAASLVAHRPLRAALHVAAGGGLVALGAAAWLIATGAVGPFLHQSFSFAVGSYVPANFRGIPRFPEEVRGVLSSHPWSSWLLQPGVWLGALVLPLLVGARLAAELVLRKRRRWRREATVVALMGTAMFLSGIYRPAAAVLWSSAPLALVMGAAALRSVARPPARARIGVVALPLVVMAALLPAGALSLQRAGVGPGNPPDPIDAVGGRLEAPPPTGPAMEAVLSFARERPDETIAFLPAVKALYLLSGRPPPLPYVVLRRGYNTDAQVREAMALLEREGVRWIVYAPWLRDLGPGPVEEEEWLFDRFLAERYEPRGRLGELRFGPLLLYEARQR